MTSKMKEQKTIKDLIDKLYNELNNMNIDYYNDFTFNQSFYQRKGLIKAINIIKEYKNKDRK